MRSNPQIVATVKLSSLLDAIEQRINRERVRDITGGRLSYDVN